MRAYHGAPFLGLAAAAVLIACGGGSGGDETEGPPGNGSGGGVMRPDGGSGTGGGINLGGGGTGGASGTGGTSAGGGGTGGGSGGSGGSATCQVSTQPATQVCADCRTGDRAGTCSTQWQACNSDSNCQKLASCVDACKGDRPCLRTCYVNNPSGTAKHLTYWGCSDATCHDQCFCPRCRLASGTPTCNDCLATKCATECKACDTNADCMALMLCYTFNCDQNDTACRNNCLSQFSKGNDIINSSGYGGPNGCSTTKCGPPTC